MSGPSWSPGFVLDEGHGDAITPVVDIGARWRELPHSDTRRRGFVLLPGEEILTPRLLAGADDRVFLRAMPAVPTLSGDGLELQLLACTGDGEHLLGEMHLGNEQAACVPGDIELSLLPYAGRELRIALRCMPGRLGDPRGDWAGVLAFVVGTGDRIGLGKARSQLQWRADNECGRFAGVYDDPIYGAAQVASEMAQMPVERAEPGSAATAEAFARAADFGEALRTVQPDAGETGFGFALRLLATLDCPRISFAARLRALAATSPRPRVLSLCAGEARVEANLLAEAGCDAELTLVDMDAALLRKASARFPAGTSVRLVQGTVEAFVPEPATYDVVMFVSGLHHVVELETVLGRAAKALAPGGEFWLIGEQVGPDGNRLWPDARRVADRLFAQLPERLRRNGATDAIDRAIPDVDYSASCFEGIRSVEIPQALARFFSPLVEERRNCFLWRFIDLAYTGNYDLERDEDVAVLKTLVAEEHAFYANGGLGCEINGAYRSKLAR